MHSGMVESARAAGIGTSGGGDSVTGGIDSSLFTLRTHIAAAVTSATSRHLSVCYFLFCAALAFPLPGGRPSPVSACSAALGGLSALFCQARLRSHVQATSLAAWLPGMCRRIAVPRSERVKARAAGPARPSRPLPPLKLVSSSQQRSQSFLQSS